MFFKHTVNEDNLNEAKKNISRFLNDNKIARDLNKMNPIIGIGLLIMLTEFYEYIVEGKEPNMEDSDNE